MSGRSPAPCATMPACWRVIAGHDPDDSTTSEKPVPDYEALLEGGVSGLRIGLALPNDGPAPLDPQIGAAVQAAADALGRLGAKVTPVTLPDFTALYRAAEVMVKCEAAAMHRPWMEKTPELYANQVRTRMEAGFFIPATQYIDALRLRAHFVKEFLATAMDGVDAVLLPAIPFPLPTIEETDTETKGGPAVLEDGGGLHRPHPAVQHARRSGAVGALRLRHATARRSACSCRPAVRRGDALPHRPRLPGRDRLHRKVPV